MAKQRLQKVLAAAGVDSRRRCEELILEGVVCVNGEVVDTLPAFVDPEHDVVTVNGVRLRAAKKVYYLLNKPKGVICSNQDPQGRTRAIDLVPNQERVFSVGRLDVDTMGLIILTNDSDLANRLTHPRYELPKMYVVSIKGRVDGEAIEKLKGVRLSQGRAGTTFVKVLKRSVEESLVEITIRQSLNRQIGRMLASEGYRMKSLRRTRIGTIDGRGLAVGQFRALSTAEVVYLRRATAGGRAGEQENR
jgi:23S rRNA pseudouridine2605 synthase